MNLQKKLCCIFGLCSAGLAAGEKYDLTNLWTESEPEKRIILQDYMQSCCDKILTAEYMDFISDSTKKAKNPVFRYYDQSFDRILEQLPKTKPAPGTVVIWYLYNMGFIIKTPTACFGVDICHRKAELLEPYLDFIVGTHNHNDHYSIPLMKKMNAAGKLVITNYFPNSGYTKAESYTHEVKGITIHCGESDHNNRLKKFTMPMEIICPTGDRNFVFFTSGDTFHHKFLKPKTDYVDLYVVHPFCGMSSVEAAKQVNAKLTFIVHLHEMTHEYNKWRWKYADGRYAHETFRNEKRDAYLPDWGEKFLWDGKKLHVTQK